MVRISEIFSIRSSLKERARRANFVPFKLFLWPDDPLPPPPPPPPDDDEDDVLLGGAGGTPPARPLCNGVVGGCGGGVDDALVE